MYKTKVYAKTHVNKLAHHKLEHQHDLKLKRRGNNKAQASRSNFSVMLERSF